MATEVCPKGRKHIGGGEAPYMKNTKYIAPMGRQKLRNRYGRYVYGKERFWMAGRIWSVFSQQIIRKKVIQYIRDQKHHHRKRSFQEEFIDILNKYGIEYDEKYIWK